MADAPSPEIGTAVCAHAPRRITKKAGANIDADMYCRQPPLYNPGNFAKNPENVFGNVLSINMFCLPREAKVTMSGFQLIEVPAGA